MTPHVFGSSIHTIDPDGRFILPARMRDMLGTSFTVTLGVDDCLQLIPTQNFFADLDNWNTGVEFGNPYFELDARELNRRFLGNANQVNADKQGRFVIPQDLREMVGLKWEVIALGLGDRVELWDKDKYQGHKKEFDSNKLQDALNRKRGEKRARTDADSPAELI